MKKISSTNANAVSNTQKSEQTTSIVKTVMKRVPIQETAKKVFAFILGYYGDYEYMPTLSEIAEHFSTRDKKYSRQWADYCLKELVREYKIKVVSRKHRGIKIV